MSSGRRQSGRAEVGFASTDSPPTPDSPGRDRFIRWWAIALALGAALNLAQFPFIESGASVWYRAIPSYGSADVGEIAPRHMPTVKRNYGLAFGLAAWSEDATVTTFPGSSLAERTQLLVGADRLEVVDYSPHIDDEAAARISEYTVVEGTDRVEGAFAIAARDETRHFIALVHDGVLILADAELLPAEFLTDPR